MKLCPTGAKGNFARRLNTLAGLICGIIGSRSCNLSKVAQKISDGSLPASREKRLYRYLSSEAVNTRTFFLPFAEMLLSSLCHLPLVLAMDGSTVGRGCMALMVCLVYKKRALPLAWTVVKGKKGHLPEERHVDLAEEVSALIPPEAQVIFLGDGEFDGINLLASVQERGWRYVCRTASNTKLCWEGESFHFQDMVEHTPVGEYSEAFGSHFTEKRYGPVPALCWWRKDCKEPIFLVSNMESAEDACLSYGKRFRIETFFSDEKSRGFNLHKSHISEPDRLARLMIGACIAHHWIVYLGRSAVQRGRLRFIHRSDRCDLSLFQLGLRHLDYLLDSGSKIPHKFWNLHNTELLTV